MLFGVILVVMMIYRPAGLIPAERRKRELKRGENGVEKENEEPGGSPTRSDDGSPSLPLPPDEEHQHVQ
jgi:hypothetical protein